MSEPFIVQIAGTITGQDPIKQLINELEIQSSNTYTKTETDTLLSGKAPTIHTHTVTQISDFTTGVTNIAYTEGETDTLLNQKVNTTTPLDQLTVAAGSLNLNS